MIKQLLNQSTIFFFLFLGLNFNNTAFSQTQERESYRILVKETLNNYFLDDNEKSFNAYTVRNNLNFDLGYKVEVTMAEFNELNEPQILVERSKEIAYSIMTEICNSVLIKQIKIDCEYRTINLYFQFKTKDYQYIKHKFSVNIQSLYELSKNMNNTGFNRILKKI